MKKLNAFSQSQMKTALFEDSPELLTAQANLNALMCNPELLLECLKSDEKVCKLLNLRSYCFVRIIIYLERR